MHRDGDTATLPETLIMAAAQVEAVLPDGRDVEEVVADKGVSQRRDAGGARRGRGSESRLGAGARSARIAACACDASRSLTAWYSSQDILSPSVGRVVRA